MVKHQLVLVQHFGFQVSEGFDPDFDLIKVGVAGQPTMYRGETEEIGELQLLGIATSDV